MTTKPWPWMTEKSEEALIAEHGPDRVRRDGVYATVTAVAALAPPEPPPKPSLKARRSASHVAKKKGHG